MSSIRENVKLTKADIDSGNFESAKHRLSQLKEDIVSFNSLFDFSSIGSPNGKDEMLLTREIFETGVLFSAKREDKVEFEQYYSQLRQFYHDFRSDLPESENFAVITGCYLLFLIVEGRLSDFHTEIELLTLSDLSNEAILFPIQLEQSLTVGSYNNVLQNSENPPCQIYSIFLRSLLDAVRSLILDCIPSSYNCPITCSSLSCLLKLPIVSSDYLLEVRPDWRMVNGLVYWTSEAANDDDDEDIKMNSRSTSKKKKKNALMMDQVLVYGHELEKIV